MVVSSTGGASGGARLLGGPGVLQRREAAERVQDRRALHLRQYRGHAAFQEVRPRGFRKTITRNEDDAPLVLRAARRFHAKTMGTAFGLFGLATVVAAWRRRDLGLTHPLSRPAANPHAVLGYLAVAAFSSQALSGVVKLAGPHPKLLADLLKGHGASGKYLFLLAAAATITGAAHVHSGSLLLDLGLYAGVAATFAVFAALAAPAPPPAAPGALSPE